MIPLCLQARGILLWVSGAFCSAFGILSPLFFGLLYDARYSNAGTLAQWLEVSVWGWILRSTMDRIPLALGKPRELFYSNLINCSGIALGFLGYHLAKLPGFILGTTLGNVCAHLFLTLRLPLGRRPMLNQSLLFSIGWLLYCGAAVLTLHRLAVFLSLEAPFSNTKHFGFSERSNVAAYALAAVSLAAAPCVVAFFKLRYRVRSFLL